MPKEAYALRKLEKRPILPQRCVWGKEHGQISGREVLQTLKLAVLQYCNPTALGPKLLVYEALSY
jgi:hypothetical protein